MNINVYSAYFTSCFPNHAYLQLYSVYLTICIHIFTFFTNFNT